MQVARIKNVGLRALREGRAYGVGFGRRFLVRGKIYFLAPHDGVGSIAARCAARCPSWFIRNGCCKLSD